jgi:hypothetical protein
MCDALLTALVAQNPAVRRKEATADWCPFHTEGSGAFAQVHHYRKQPGIKVWCAGDPRELQAAATARGVDLHTREKLDTPWALRFPAWALVADAAMATQVAMMLTGLPAGRGAQGGATAVVSDAVTSPVDAGSGATLDEAALERWADRSRRTARLVQACYDHASVAGRLDGATIAALCRLTWITVGKSGEPDPVGTRVPKDYWVKTKLPGLRALFDIPPSVTTLAEAAAMMATRAPGTEWADFVLPDTGFVNAYNAFRNALDAWCAEHASQAVEIAAQARVAESDAAGARLVARVAALPPIRSGRRASGLPASNMLMPLLSCLEPRGRLPVINGAPHVTKMLMRLGVSARTLAAQHLALVRLIDPTDPLRRDAFGLDMHGIASDVPRRPAPGHEPPSTAGGTVGRPLGLKDEREIEATIRGGIQAVTQRHDAMTNRLVKLLEPAGLVAVEGAKQNCLFDVLVRSFDGRGTDLLVEVKSTTDRSSIRLAVGQLLDYRRGLERPLATDLLVLLPSQPEADAIHYLHSVGIKASWFTSVDGGVVRGDWSLG